MAWVSPILSKSSQLCHSKICLNSMTPLNKLHSDWAMCITWSVVPISAYLSNQCHSKFDYTPLQDFTSRLHSMAPFHKLHSVILFIYLVDRRSLLLLSEVHYTPFPSKNEVCRHLLITQVKAFLKACLFKATFSLKSYI